MSTQPVERDEWVVIDFETASSRGTPCQVGAIRFVDGREVDALTTYVFQPPHLFDAFNVALHGITPSDVKAAPHWPTVRDQLTAFADGAPFVAHYAPFDMESFVMRATSARSSGRRFSTPAQSQSHDRSGQGCTATACFSSARDSGYRRTQHSITPRSTTRDSPRGCFSRQ